MLDVTRLVSRMGRGPLTGVDRVEFAYLTHLLTLDGGLFGLVRTAAGFLLLDRAGMQALAGLIRGGDPGPADLLSRLTNRRDPLRARAEASVRRLAVKRTLHSGLGRLIRALPEGASYLNVGHSDLTDATLAALHRRLRVTVLLHDTIPLDHPAYSRPDTVAGFAAKLAAVAAHADLVVHLTQDARHKTEAHLARAGRCPVGVVAGLGVPIPQPGPLPNGIVPPFFLVLGTVEPRKNHALLLQVWRDLARNVPVPTLCVVGSKGWAAPKLLDDLTATPGIMLLSGLPDPAVAALLAHATALLFPTFAEGFGLPPVEAAALGTPVISSDLPVIREGMGDYPVYLDPSDSYAWMETIRGLLEGGGAVRNKPRLPPSWDDHFKTVLNLA